MSSKLTVAQLKAELTKKGIEFEPKMKKAALVLLLDGEEKEEEDRDAEEAPKATKAKAKAKKATKGKKRAEPEPAEEEEAPETDVKKILEKKAKETKKSTGVKKKVSVRPRERVWSRNDKLFVVSLVFRKGSHCSVAHWQRVPSVSSHVEPDQRRCEQQQVLHCRDSSKRQFVFSLHEMGTCRRGRSVEAGHL